MMLRCPQHRGFTVVEMTMGLVVLAMIMLAIAGIMTAVAQAWTDQEMNQSTQIQANQIYARVQHILSAAKYVAQYNPGSLTGNPAGSIFFWRADDYPASPNDETVQAGEMALIVQDPTTSTLWLYEAMPYTQMTPAQYAAAGQVYPWSYWTTPSTVAAFKTSNFLTAQPVPLGGPGNLSNPGNYLQITGAQFYVYSLAGASQLPVIEFALAFSRNNQSLNLYSSTTLRGPSTQPSP
jgi:type II secretory pathway pseudopilin PulG